MTCVALFALGIVLGGIIAAAAAFVTILLASAPPRVEP